MTPELEMAYIDGLMAYSIGQTEDQCTYKDKFKDAWLLGFTEQKMHSQLKLKVIALRQAIKCQAKTIANHIDIEEQVQHDSEKWWTAYLAKEAGEALRDSGAQTKTLEKLMASAIRLYRGGGFYFEDGEVRVNQEKATDFQHLAEAIDNFVDKKC